MFKIKNLILICLLYISTSVFANTNEFKNFVELSKTNKYGLIFIFSSQCRHCHKMIPIVDDIKNKYGIDVYAIEQNGTGYGPFQDVIPLTQEIADKYYPYGQVMFPYIALQQLNGDMTVYPVGIGETSEDDLLSILNKYSKRILSGQSTQTKVETYTLGEND